MSLPVPMSSQSPPPAGKACLSSAETALNLLWAFFCSVFFPWHCDAQIILVFISWGGKKLCSLQKKISEPKVPSCIPKCDSCTCLHGILILIQVLKRTCWQENFLLISQLLSILERHTQYFIVHPLYHIIQREGELFREARACHFPFVCARSCILVAGTLP